MKREGHRKDEESEKKLKESPFSEKYKYIVMNPNYFIMHDKWLYMPMEIETKDAVMHSYKVKEVETKEWETNKRKIRYSLYTDPHTLETGSFNVNIYGKRWEYQINVSIDLNDPTTLCLVRATEEDNELQELHGGYLNDIEKISQIVVNVDRSKLYINQELTVENCVDYDHVIQVGTNNRGNEPYKWFYTAVYCRGDVPCMFVRNIVIEKEPPMINFTHLFKPDTLIKKKFQY